jgi:hypothetical protein
MSEDEKRVNANSTEFKQGVEAGLNSEEDTKNWKAGNELGRELKEETEPAEPALGNTPGASPPPLFMRGHSDGARGDAQDEKDETPE